MSKTGHIFYLSILVAIVILITLALIQKGVPYYKTNIEERVFHQDHIVLKPSGIIGHGIGIAGSLSLIIGMGSYMARKRYRFLSRIGILKHWLEFHIFLCTLGTILIIFHTSYKIGGLVAISFWSMVAVFMSGIIGRFIYIQIPRTIEGRELSLNEGYRYVDYTLPENSVNLLQNIGEASLAWQILEKFSLSISYEGTFEKEYRFDRIYLQVRKRF